MLVGYSRVSTLEQNADLQHDALKKADCTKYFTDKISGAKAEREALNQALAFVRPGDTLVVWKLDRLGRSLKHLIETVSLLQEKGVGLKSLTENIDTTTSSGKLIFHFFGALADILAARARGRTGGRPKGGNFQKVTMARKLHADKSNTIEDICRNLGISRATLYRYIKSV